MFDVGAGFPVGDGFNERVLVLQMIEPFPPFFQDMRPGIVADQNMSPVFAALPVQSAQIFDSQVDVGIRVE